jgi:hypothetical protein
VLARLIPRLLGAPEQAPGAANEGGAQEGALLAGIAPERVHGMMQDRTSSHLIEARRLSFLHFLSFFLSFFLHAQFPFACPLPFPGLSRLFCSSTVAHGISMDGQRSHPHPNLNRASSLLMEARAGWFLHVPLCFAWALCSLLLMAHTVSMRRGESAGFCAFPAQAKAIHVSVWLAASAPAADRTQDITL